MGAYSQYIVESVPGNSWIVVNRKTKIIRRNRFWKGTRGKQLAQLAADKWNKQAEKNYDPKWNDPEWIEYATDVERRFQKAVSRNGGFP